RMRLIANMISTISPNSPLAAAAQTRMADLEAIDDISQLAGIELLRGDRTGFSDVVYRGWEHNPFFGARSVVIDGPTGGQVNVVGEGQLFFLGMREELIAFIVHQD